MALTAVSQALSIDARVNHIKAEGPEKLLYPIQIMVDGWEIRTPTMKELPIKVDILEFLVKMALGGTSKGEQSTTNLAIITFYYLMWIGEYTYKRSRN